MIKIDEVLNFPDEKRYKVHLANWNGESHPLDVFVKSKDEWKKKKNGLDFQSWVQEDKLVDPHSYYKHHKAEY